MLVVVLVWCCQIRRRCRKNLKSRCFLEPKWPHVQKSERAKSSHLTSESAPMTSIWFLFNLFFPDFPLQTPYLSPTSHEKVAKANQSAAKDDTWVIGNRGFWYRRFLVRRSRELKKKTIFWLFLKNSAHRRRVRHRRRRPLSGRSSSGSTFDFWLGSLLVSRLKVMTTKKRSGHRRFSINIDKFEFRSVSWDSEDTKTRPVG